MVSEGWVGGKSMEESTETAALDDLREATAEISSTYHTSQPALATAQWDDSRQTAFAPTFPSAPSRNAYLRTSLKSGQFANEVTGVSSPSLEIQV